MVRQPGRAEWSRESGEGQPAAPPSGSGAGEQGAGGDLGEVMGQVARSLQREHGDVDATLQAITDAAVGAVPGADECSISFVVQRRRVEPRAATGELARRADRLQERLQEGSCLDAVWQEETVRIDDMAAEQRWPRFAQEAARLGIGSSLSFRLFVAGDTLGGLNLYSARSNAFGQGSVEVGLVFASHAAVALSGAQQQEHLRLALDHRDLIGQAKGILMERFNLTGDQAFTTLARVSQQTNRKLFDLAEELCETGAMPASERAAG